MKIFLHSMTSILKLFPSHHLSYSERFGTDEERLRSDWEKIGNDIRHALKEWKHYGRGHSY